MNFDDFKRVFVGDQKPETLFVGSSEPLSTSSSTGEVFATSDPEQAAAFALRQFGLVAVRYENDSGSEHVNVMVLAPPAGAPYADFITEMLDKPICLNAVSSSGFVGLYPEDSEALSPAADYVSETPVVVTKVETVTCRDLIEKGLQIFIVDPDATCKMMEKTPEAFVQGLRDGGERKPDSQVPFVASPVLDKLQSINVNPEALTKMYKGGHLRWINLEETFASAAVPEKVAPLFWRDEPYVPVPPFGGSFLKGPGMT